MDRLLEKLFNIEKGELARSLLMFVYAFLLLSAYLILKPVRNSLFLVKFSADELPIMYMIIAAFAAPIASVYGRIATKTSLPKLIGGSIIVIISNLIIFWYLISADYDWLVYVFYVWVSLFGIFTTSQFWLLANYVFDAREAKRLFAFIGAGAITGGITGSLLTNLFASVLGTENLLWVCVAFMLLIFGILMIVWPMRAGDEDDSDSRKRHKHKQTKIKGLWPVIARSKHLSLLTGVIAVTVIVSSFVDFQFNAVVHDAIQDKDELTAFFGLFFSGLSVISLILQLLFSSRILRRFGVGVAILVLPVGLLLGSTAIFIWPVLASAVLVKLSDGSFRYSINKTGLELLYMPIPANLKSKVKALMDVVGDRAARGLGGALLFLFNNMLHWPVRWISLLSAILIGVWITLTVLIKREYSRTFREALDTRAIDSDDVRVQLHNPESIRQLSTSLRSDNEREVLFALEFTGDIRDQRLAEPLAELLSHDNPSIRARAIEQLRDIGAKEYIDSVADFMRDENADVRTQAIHFLAEYSDQDQRNRFEQACESDDPIVRAAALRCALERKGGDAPETLISTDRIQSLLETEGEQRTIVRREVARSLRFLPPAHDAVHYIPKLMADPDPQVRRGALASAAALKRREYLPVIIGYLDDPHLRGLAVDALVSYGPGILGELRDQLRNETLPLPVRMRIPKVMSNLPPDEVVPMLLEQLDLDNILLRYHVIKGLSRARRNYPDYQFDGARIRKLIREETRNYYYLAAHKKAVASHDNQTDSVRLLGDAILDRCDRHLEQAFRFAGLVHDRQDMYFAYNGVTSDSQLQRARAIEFLDTVWGRPEKEILFPIFEEQERILEYASTLFGIPGFDFDTTIRQCLNGADPWLAACATQVALELQLTEYRDDVKPHTASSHPALKEVADRTVIAFA